MQTAHCRLCETKRMGNAATGSGLFSVNTLGYVKAFTHPTRIVLTRSTPPAPSRPHPSAQEKAQLALEP
jgi:hypothetical protein